ncbi:SDR family NAD(P)-dependent oxidoreductase [Algiphilus sp.]|uniref:SDR family NAD(P)-dependent oxidoreductase n=1 Tax=Algiphilus sp. TaxID=1872431 RepID=UPI0025C3705A|nr:SDR family NAD(P)-dependent oxidoreductase [Algiphilus sp.]MCK5769527.1 SDR family NAD(P)-dependent oxidoreductase [Algiphilus sp.]
MVATGRKDEALAARAVVTGAGSGIGRAFARELGRRGGRVVCADIDIDRARETVDMLRSEGADGLPVQVDVGSLQQVEQMAEQADAFFSGAPTLVVNNAGVGAGGQPIGVTPIADWQWVLNVNLWGVIHGSHVFMPRLRDQGFGGVINVCSTASFAAAPRMGPYSTSKAAALALTETLAAEASGSGVSVTALCPTFVKTDIVRSGRIEAGAQALAGRLMASWSVAPERVVRDALRGLARGQLYVVPQLDARTIWRTKRWMPALYTRGAGRLNRLLAARA